MHDFDRFDDPIDTEEELRETYPTLYGIEEKPYEPPGYKLSPKHQKYLDEQRAKLADRREFEDEFGDEYQHSIDDLTDEMLPTLNFRRWDNLFLARPANAYLEAGENAGPVKRRLLGDLWLEGEMSVLFSETGLGKSALAMQIARALTGGKPFEPFATDIDPIRCAYFDFELTDDQFRLRYTAERPDPLDTGKLFPDALIRLPPQLLRSMPAGFENYYDFLIESIFQHVEMLKVRSIIIDNITWLNPNVENSPSMQRLMQTLAYLKKNNGVSILLIAHTPKRLSRGPITINHLQGAATLGRYIDSAFALGASRRGHDIRYLKAVKHRNTAGREADAEVISLRLGKTGRFLGFDPHGSAFESEHCGWGYGDGSSEAFIESVLELLAEKHSQRQIAQVLNVSEATVRRCIGALNKK